ncbi:MAG: MgtC/SapB family protein [Verrucomicrobiota bacterium]
MGTIADLEPLGIALGLGLLVGLQRERTDAQLAGFRTFPLVTVAGTLCAQLAVNYGGWVVALGFLSVAALIVVGNLARIKAGVVDPGLTTEAALLVMYGVGAYLVAGNTAVALVVGGGVAVLLHLKPQMHEIAGRIGDRDFKAIMQFVLITMVILPVLPNKFFGPYSVLNPFRVWLMVVLIVGISLGGYVAYKIFGQKAGAVAGGVLGGLISSTATTVSYARRSRETPQLTGLCTFVILCASTVVFVRVLVLISLTAPGYLAVAGPPLGVMFAALLVLTGITWSATRKESAPMPEQENPSELKPAILFAGLYAAVLLAVAVAKEHLGQGGLYTVAVLSGLTDMDAITLSISQLVHNGQLPEQTGWRLILTAAMSNLVFKTGTVAVLGGRALLGRAGALFGAAFAVGVIILAAW